MSGAQNVIHGSHRNRYVTRDGVNLERAYLYLPSDAWRKLYDLSATKGLSASQYIDKLIQAADSQK